MALQLIFLVLYRKFRSGIKVMGLIKIIIKLLNTPWSPDILYFNIKNNNFKLHGSSLNGYKGEKLAIISLCNS